MASTASVPQNIDPIHPHVARVGWSSADGDGGAAGAIKTANTTKDGVSGALNLIFTAGLNGSMLNVIRFRSAGTNVQAVARIFLNNGSTLATLANNVLWKEITLPETTLSEEEAQPDIVVPGLFLPAGYKVYVAIGTTVSDGWRAIAEGGDF